MYVFAHGYSIEASYQLDVFKQSYIKDFVIDEAKFLEEFAKFQNVFTITPFLVKNWNGSDFELK